MTAHSRQIFFLAILGLLCGFIGTAQAQSVDVRVSTREAYVGQPIVLQIVIDNTQDFEQPSVPDIEGCDVQARGTPSVSTQITIINGRRTDRRSVVMQYLITPLQAGDFKIPELSFKVDGRVVRTEPIEFSATKSETGDLLLVEIEGIQKQVYVGQPLDLTLKIWLKPYTDKQLDLRLSAGSMWSLIAKQTNWGSFRERVEEFAANDQRPGGMEVLRDDGTGKKQAYYLYEIEATVYPKRPGKIEADDVQIIVDYPTALERSRDPFDRFFEDSPFGNLSQRMGGDLFASPFSDQLVVADSRPIVAGAEVDATKVLPVPEAGRPADYRGAVGKYRIATEATPTQVAAGDPITLQIEIVGDGPMELVQAPPLGEMEDLTKDFKVEDQSLAGFVQDDRKLFVTTIRPRREGITAIPAIPFSYFDPQTESYHTTTSRPIAIVVDQAETLAIDSIVQSAEPSQPIASPRSSAFMQPDFANVDSPEVLESQIEPSATDTWWALVVFPPVIWLGAWLIRYIGWLTQLGTSCAGRLRSAEALCLTALEKAKGREQLDEALMVYVQRKTRSAPANSQLDTLGSLRLCGLYTEAAELEQFFAAPSKTATTWGTSVSLAPGGEPDRADGTWLEAKRSRAEALLRELKAAFDGISRLPAAARSRQLNRASAQGMQGHIASWLIALALGTSMHSTSMLGTSMAFADELSATDATGVDKAITYQAALQLDRQQREQLLAEAAALYNRGTELAGTDRAEANELLTQAAGKYQQLVDAGIRNGRLYFNLGNAYLLSNRLGLAIAAYEQVLALDPWNQQLRINLQQAESLVERPETESAAIVTASWLDRSQRFNAQLLNRLGEGTVCWTLGIASVLFWGMLTLALFSSRLPLKRLALVPLVPLLMAAASLGLAASQDVSQLEGVVIVDRLILRAGDGERFEELTTVTAADGQRVQVLAERDGWLQIQTHRGQTGWVSRQSMSLLKPRA